MNSLRAAILAGLGLGIAAVTPAAAAVSAFVSITITERAGPSTYYPVVTVIPGGATLTLYGCLSDGSWCDVSYAAARGWVPGAYVEAYYQAHPVYVPRYIAEIGVPVVSFDIGFYWNSYYHDRPFFAERDRYERHVKGPGAQVAVVATGNGKTRHFVPGNGHVQTFVAAGAKGKHRRQIETFAAAGPSHGKGPHPIITAGASGKGKGAQIAAGPNAKVAMAHRRGKACQG